MYTAHIPLLLRFFPQCVDSIIFEHKHISGTSEIRPSNHNCINRKI